MAKPFLISAPGTSLFDNSGILLSGGAKVFTYQAGTTTKLATYSTQTDAINSTNANANPIIVGSSGRFPTIWATQAVKVVVAPSNDTDPPVNPYWTLDNITATAQIVTTVTKTTNYTVTVSDRDKLFLLDASSGSLTITLLLGSVAGDGFNLKFKKIDSSNNSITIQASGSDLIDGNGTYSLLNQYDYTEMYNDNSTTSWSTIRNAVLNIQTFKDINANTILAFITTASAGNYITITNAATGNSPIIGSAGNDANPGITITPKGSGNTVITSGNLTVSAGGLTIAGTELIQGSSSSADGLMKLQQRSANGTNTVALQSPATLAASILWVLPNADATTANNALVSNAAGVLSFTASPVITTAAVQTFTSSGTYTPTSGMKFCIAKVLGAGGGGGGSGNGGSTNYTAAGGGGAGGYAEVLLTASQIGGSQTVTIGGGGAGGLSGSNNGSSGTTTSLGSLVSCTGGNGGGSGSALLGGAGGAPTVSTGSTIVSSNGMPGNPGLFAQGTVIGTSGNGASSPLGAGAVGVLASGNLNGNNGIGHGSGGSGGANISSATAGGNGTNGIIVVLEFISS